MISKVADEDMMIAADKSNQDIIVNRKNFLLANGIDINQMTRSVRFTKTMIIFTITR